MILHTVGSLGTDAGGPSRTVPALCQSLVALGDFDVRLLTARSSQFGANRVFNDLAVTESDNHSVRGWSNTLGRMIQDSSTNDKQQRTVLHDHGQWLAINRASALAARKHGIPRVITPRGMLSPWAMNFHRRKKLAAWFWFGRRDAAAADVLHATSELEASELRSLGLVNPIAVIPNGVDRPSHNFINCSKNRQVIFLSRLHPKKGVAELIDVWRRLQPDGWQLLLAGPDEANMLRNISIADDPSIHYIGEVEGKRKWQLLSESSLFVLPSYSENFGVVVAEALVAGTPVITTHGTPWSSLQTERCGWWIPMDRESLFHTLRNAVTTSSTELEAMGVRGRHYADAQFSWRGIASEMSDVYRWLLDEQGPPDCVQFK